MLDNITINGRKYIPVDQLHNGNSDVFVASDDTGDLVTIKHQNITSNPSFDEVGILTEIKDKHPSFPTIVDSMVSGNVFYIVIKYIHGMDLMEYVEKHKSKLTYEFVKNIGKKLFQVLDKIHGMGIVHSDIKLENIIYSPVTDDIHIIDWGYSIRLADIPKRTSPAGTAQYVAPELMGSNGKKPVIGTYNDIWSAGVVLYAVLLQRFPFDTDFMYSLINRDMDYDALKSDQDRLFFSTLFEDYTKRPDAKTVLQHTWLN